MAIANTIGLAAIPNNISGDMMFPAESPRNTSAPTKASCKVMFLGPFEYLFCRSDKSVLSEESTPSLSNMMIWSGLMPNNTYKLAQAKAAEPAPETTIFTSSIFLSANSKALSNAAEEMIAVPCWSSCITGIFNSSTSLFSISNDSGALMSSRLIPPKVGAIFFTVSINFSTSFVSTSMSKTSISAKILNSNAFPSITGLEASGPISPNPKTAVPFEITATRFPLAVYL
ncbi:hypothetical protein D3C86_1214590 [compost metagenome]